MQTCDAEIVQPEVDVSQQAVVLVDKTIDASIETVSPIVQVNAEEYVLSSGGMYGGSGLVGAVPDWILKAVQQQLTTGDGNLMQVLTDLQALMTAFQIGVNQQITSLNTDMYSENGIVTTISSQVEQNRADAISLIATKATPEYALAVATDAINAKFNSEFGGVTAEAFVGNIASTYVDANSAIAQEINLLAASYNDTTVKIEDLREVSVGTFSEWDGVSTPQLGQFTKDGNGTWYQYLGDIEGWVITNMAHSLASTSSVNAELETFASVVAGNLSDLQSQLDGEITSWFYSYAPSQANEPWATWIASDTASGTTVSQDQHTGDLFYDLTSEIAYRFSKSAGVFGWGIISDDIIIKALADASRAQDTADAKRRVFVNQPIPPYDIGDLWAGGPSGDVKKCKVAKAAGAAYAVGDWELASKYTDDTAALRTVRMFTSVNSSIPTAEGVGDLWSVSDRWYTNATGTTESSSQTANGLVLRRWSGSAWVTIARETKNTYASVAWAATASSIIRDPLSDAITGWSYADGSGTKSQFGIHADNFYIKNSTYGNRPFSISGSDILFNGKVSFNSVTGAPAINKTFVQTSAPTSGMVAGDTWLDSDGGYAVYTYSGSSWVAGGVKTYSQTAAPTSGMITGDLWIDTDNNNRVYRYNGTSWVDQTLTSGGIIKAINGTTNTTTIDGGKITTGTITANQIAANTITSSQLTTGIALINGEVKSSDFTTIGGAGFRLKSNAAGTSTDPTIYGAYIKGGTLNGVNLIGEVLSVNNMKFNDSSYPSNTANVLVKGRSQVSINNNTAYGAAVTFVSASYGSGFRADRIVALSKMFIFDYRYSKEISNSIWGSAGRIQVSIDGASYYDILHILEGTFDFDGNVNPPYSGKIYIPLSFSSTISFIASASSTNDYNNASMAFDVECFNFNFS